MKSVADAVVTFLKSEDGPTAVEYAVMTSMIIMVCIIAIQAVGQNTVVHFEDARDALT